MLRFDSIFNHQHHQNIGEAGSLRRKTLYARVAMEALEPRILFTTALLGVNLEGVADNSRSFMFADAMKSARHFGTAATPWDEAVPVDANGWPTGDAGATIIMLDNDGPTPIRIDGTYHFSAIGRVDVSPVVTDAYVTNWNYDEVSNTTTADVVVNPGAQALHLNFTGDPDGAKDIHLWRPGTVPGETFTPEFLQSLQGAQVLRLMDYTLANSTDIREWADRAKPTDARQSDLSKGAAWEYAIELANTLDKDLWVNVPAGASDDYVQKMATLFHDTLEPGRHIYVEYSNEVWNSTYWRQFWTNYGAAQADETSNPSDLNWDNADNTYQFAWRRVAKRLIQIRDIFADAYGPGSINDEIRPVLGSQVAWAYVLSDQLSYLQHRFGRDLSSQIYAVAGAPYMSLPTDLNESPGLTTDQIIAGLYQNLQGMQPGIQKFEALAVEHDLKYFFYEGGIDLQGDIGGNFPAAKMPANYDPRMKDLVKTYLENAFSNGVDGVMYYGHVSAYTTWGTWGLTDSVQALDAPKMQGFRAVAAEETPEVTTGIALPAGYNGVTFDAGNYLMDVWASTGGGGVIQNASGEYTYLLNVTSASDYAIQLATSSWGSDGLLGIDVDGVNVGQVQVPASGAAFANTAPLSLTTLFGGSLTPGHHSLTIRVVSGQMKFESITIGSGGYGAPPPAPPVPGDVNAAGGASAITLTWSDVAGESGYKLERSHDGVTWSQVALLPADVTTYTDSGLPVGAKYWYRLRATNVGSDSGYTALVSAATVMPVPTGMDASAGGSTSITLTWSPVAGAVSYVIQRMLNGKTTWITLTRVRGTTTSFTDYGLSCNTAYSYRIYAVSLDGVLSAASDVVTSRTRNKDLASLRGAPKFNAI